MCILCPLIFLIALGEHLPLRSDGILLHPDTMRECDIVVASPVVVRSTFGGENSDSSPNSGLVVCKAWPLMQLPLDGGYLSYTQGPNLTIYSILNGLMNIS